MNLQICAPYQRCIYGCPFCVAMFHPQHNHQFDNMYKDDPILYQARLIRAIQELKPECVVITGECDPTQDLRWCYDVIRTVRQNFPEIRIEFQTHNLSLDEHTYPNDIDVLAYSITNAREYLSSWRCYKHPKAINRMVIITTTDFDFLNKDNFCAMGFNQITFKALNQTENYIINNWIKDHTPTNLNRFYEIVDSRNGSSVSMRVDTNCQQAEGRYYIYRSDGEVYKNWETKEKENI